MANNTGMLTHTKLSALGLLVVLVFASGFQKASSPASGPEYSSDGQMKMPENYREWVYLSTGFDMSYNPAMQMDHHMFDNVFVNPESYKAFLKAGAWPDKTVFILEARRGEAKGSINQAGNYQSQEIMGMEAHVKDSSRFQGNWAFFRFNGAKTATMIPTTSDCYSCHAAHGAVDTTFVQFYPTLASLIKAH